MAYVNTTVELAKCIDSMSYSGLLSVARALVEMNAPEAGSGRDINTEHGMADTIADWAQAVVEGAEAEAARAKAQKAA